MRDDELFSHDYTPGPLGRRQAAIEAEVLAKDVGKGRPNPEQAKKLNDLRGRSAEPTPPSRLSQLTSGAAD